MDKGEIRMCMKKFHFFSRMQTNLPPVHAAAPPSPARPPSPRQWAQQSTGGVRMYWRVYVETGNVSAGFIAQDMARATGRTAGRSAIVRLLLPP